MPNFVITGVASPDCTGLYRPAGYINGHPYYTHTSGTTTYVLWTTNGNKWIVTTSEYSGNVLASSSWFIASGGPEGSYSPIGSYTGTLTIAQESPTSLDEYFPFETIQSECISHLLAQTEFSANNIAVLNPSDPNYPRDLKVAMETYGIGVVLVPFILNATKPDISGPYFDDIRISAHVFEDIQITKTYHALKVACFVAHYLHHFVPLSNAGNAVFCTTPTVIPIPDDDFLIYAVNFQTSIGIVPITVPNPPIACC